MKTLIFRFFGIMVIAGLLVTSCNTGITYPPVSKTPTGEYHPGQFVWHDLATSNPEAAMNFYRAVFGWEYTTYGTGDKAYYVITNNGKPIGGIFKLPEKYSNVSEWVGSVSVPDVDAAVAYNKTQGGQTIYKAVTFKGRGTTALVQDPQGAIVAFLHAEGGDPGFSEVDENSWLWNELWTTDMEGSQKYYKDLLGFYGKSILGAKAPYFVFEKEKQKYFGIIGNPVEGARSAWMPYIRVSDVKTTVAKTTLAEGEVMMEPNKEIRKGKVAVLLDPVGAQFTVQEWPIK